MLVSRKYLDATAAVCCGGPLSLIASGLKPVPSVVSYLGGFGILWAILLVLGSLGAAIGAILRTRDSDRIKRRRWSVGLERVCWPAVAGAALVFCIGVISRFGFLDAALTLGWTGFVVFVCLGNWWVIRQAGRGAHS